MKKNFLKVLTVGVLAGGVMFSSAQALVQTGNNNYPLRLQSSVQLAKNDSLKDGTYTVGIQVLKEKDNDLSMAGQYIGQNIKLDVKNGVIYANVDITRLDWMKNINIFVDGSDVKYETSKKGSQAGTLRFKVPSTKAKIMFKMNVVPMGNARVAFRVVMQNDVKAVSGSATINNTSNNTSQKKSVDNKKDNKNSNTTDKKELPQTGLPITQAELPMLGGLTTIAGMLLLKKKNK
ncbi:NEAT domain-containing protein [Clostridium botulinum]|uniref:Cell surface protein n=1 Tax=Clostridium botulinum TaxID=1491 RepID=A0A9Q1V042_CLOBO|nr:NEAT domain-containing protein [Clostridium botulinum]AEB75286.1 NPQTN cell wall surface anchor protein, putative [Clostridium botulinum BKT015925]KEI00875.1 cell surface protein [Clostridium botulinum C/D str. Sp77]KEI02273.1 cell surface protein [Clostridium botulinum D str. 16868]KLU75077.1 cell surface protein [Clostridium botulinum V891]KOA75050.1 cell surface protein [Clostridium botulinum]